ncbi:hypothetical protein CAPTEDRAFT_228004 [Capitella teleta]|uniref:Uncharacterized protein n=1 Tax=Capitella teleta TaxID=283909 RepID=R7U4R6_CAPTE|nr:hypothetical protein CAPTEDRAFT_228004 [Capitella teleta]|eukprot:ELU01360.1 hypothetical protein CAPTEDRAFT_228004 [Capitella teleta]
MNSTSHQIDLIHRRLLIFSLRTIVTRFAWLTSPHPTTMNILTTKDVPQQPQIVVMQQMQPQVMQPQPGMQPEMQMQPGMQMQPQVTVMQSQVKQPKRGIQLRGDENDWTTKMAAVLDDIPILMCGWFCPCVLAIRLGMMLDENPCFCICPGHLLGMMTKVRGTFNIRAYNKGSILSPKSSTAWHMPSNIRDRHYNDGTGKTINTCFVFLIKEFGNLQILCSYVDDEMTEHCVTLSWPL